MGACLLATEKSFQAAVPQLCGLAKALRAEAGDDSLLLHIDATTGKVRSQLPASTWSLIASQAALQWRCPCSNVAFNSSAVLVSRKFILHAARAAAGDDSLLPHTDAATGKVRRCLFSSRLMGDC